MSQDLLTAFGQQLYVDAVPKASDGPDMGVERAERNLRDSISTGSLHPGQRLSEVRLAKEYGLSRGPIREALRRLERERLVTAVPNRGTFVTRLTIGEFIETLEIRVLLEPFALEQAVIPRIDPLAVRLQAVLNEMADRCQRDDLAALPGLHARFHGAFYEHSKNKALEATWRGLEASVELRLQGRVETQDEAVALLETHTTLTRVIVEGGISEGRRALVNHLRDAASKIDVPFLPYSQRVLRDVEEQADRAVEKGT
jgi:DNA-binding GntR family transcriptional regulator